MKYWHFLIIISFLFVLLHQFVFMLIIFICLSWFYMKFTNILLKILSLNASFMYSFWFHFSVFILFLCMLFIFCMFGSKQSLGRRHLNSVTSQDSGFTSQDTLYNNVNTSSEYTSQVSRAKFHVILLKKMCFCTT